MSQVFSAKAWFECSVWLFGCVCELHALRKPLVEPGGDQGLSFLLLYGTEVQKQWKIPKEYKTGNVPKHKTNLPLPHTPSPNFPSFSLSRQCLLVSVCRIQGIIGRGRGRCVSQSVSALLTGLHGWLLTVLRIVSTYTTIVTWNVPILLGSRPICVGNYVRCWIYRIEPPKSCHLLHTIVGLAPHHWVMHKPVCIRRLRQEERKLRSIALMCLIEVAAIAKWWQSEERWNSVDLSMKWVMIKIAINLKAAIGPTATPTSTRTARAGSQLLRR